MSDKDNSIDPEWYHPEQMPYKYFGDMFIGSDRELTPDEYETIVEIMKTRDLRHHQDIIERDDGKIVIWTALYVPYGFQSLPDNDPPEPKGVWVAYLPNSPRAMIFETEIEALRMAVEKSCTCKFWEFGTELNSLPSVKEVYENFLLTANEMRKRYYPFDYITDLETNNDDKPD